MTEPILAVEDLVVRARTGAMVLARVSAQLGAGESLGLVGESGSGKTTLAQALLGYARPGLQIVSGSVRVAGTEMVGRAEDAVRPLRGSLVSYVPQDPASALNPSVRVGDQIRELLRVHAKDRATFGSVGELLRRVELPPDRAFQRRYPHQLSGGQQQRVAIALALSCDPKLIVLDEPTTGLDVVTQGLILEEVLRLQRELTVTLVYVSHDLAAVATVAGRVAVMYAGHVLEQAPTSVVTTRPRHPYTRGLVSSVPDHHTPRELIGIPGVAPDMDNLPVGCPFQPRCDMRIEACATMLPALVDIAADHAVRCVRWQDTGLPDVIVRHVAPQERLASLLAVDGLVATYRTHGELMTAVSDVTFSLGSGECLALVGESGSGKTTTARCVVGLHQPSAGSIRFDGQELAPLARKRPAEQRRRIQVVFQNPYESLNPRQSVASQVSWPARSLRGCSRVEARAEVTRLLERVRLPGRTAERYPGELSGGERQRVAIARALAAQPDLLVCDEITSALDVSVQAAVLDLLRELRMDLGLALLFITHDLGVVASVADEVLVLEHGKTVEIGSVQTVLRAPIADYTRRLIDAAPSLSQPAGDAPDREMLPQ
jgi:peptide/nickel transport system ATP-binding protein